MVALTNELIESVARAMLSGHDLYGGGFTTWDEMSDDWQEAYRSMARAAIKAVRDFDESFIRSQS